MRVRRLLRWFGVAVAAVLVVAITVPMIYLYSGWGQNQLRGLIESQARRFLDGELHVQRLSGTLLTHVTLTGVRFDHGGQTVFEASTVEVGYSAWRLLRGARDVSSIRVVNPVVRLSEANNTWSPGTWMRPRAKRPSTGPPLPFFLPVIEVVNGTLFSTARESLWRIPPELNHINGVVRLKLGGGTDITLAGLRFATPDGRFQSLSTDGTIQVHQDTRLDLTLASNAGGLRVTGTIGPSAPRALALRAALTRMDARIWRVWTPMLDTVTFVASGSSEIGGTIEHTAIQADLSTTGGNVKANAAIASSPGVLTISGDADLARFDFESVTASEQWASAVSGRSHFQAVSKGAPAEWTVDVRLDGGPVQAFGVAAERLDGTARYDDRRVTFDTRATAYGATGHAVGTIVTLPELTIDARGDGWTNVVPRQLPQAWGIPQVEAVANARTFDVQWREGHWHATSELDASTLEGAAVSAGTRVELTSEPDHVQMSAEGDLRDVNARRVGVAFGFTGLDDPLFDTRVSGHVKVTGDGRDWTNIDLSARGALVNAEAAGARMPTASVVYTRLNHLNTAHVIGPVLGLDPVALGAPASAAGRLNGQADMVIDWRDDADDVAASMGAHGTVELRPSTFMQEAIDRGTISGEWRNGLFSAQRVELEGKGLRVSGRGPIAVSAGTSNATFEIAAEDLAALEPLIGRHLTGAGTASGTLTGTAERPRLTAHVSSKSVADAALGTAAGVTADVDLEIPEWDTTRVAGAVKGALASLQTPGGSAARDIAVDGKLLSSTRFSGRVNGTWRDYPLQSAFNADWQHDLTLDIVELQAVIEGERWRLDPSTGPVRVSASGISARTALFATEGRSVSVTAAVTGGTANPNGRIEFAAKNLNARGYAIADLAGSIAFAAGAGTVDVKMTQPDGVVLTVAGRVPVVWLVGPDAIAAGVPRPDWDLRAISEPLELKIFAPLVPRLQDIAGESIIDLRVVGAAMQPDVTGTVAVTGGQFRVPSAGVSFSQVVADVGFAANTLSVRRFVARDKHDHQLVITGQLGVGKTQNGNLEVNLEADRVLVLDNGIGQIELSTLLGMSGDLAHPRLRGNVEVVSGRVEVDHLLRALQGDPLALVTEADLPPEGVTEVDTRAEDAAAAAAAPASAPTSRWSGQSLLSALDADVHLLAADNLILRGSSIRPAGKNGWSLGDLNVTVGSDLTVSRRPGADATLTGDVTTIRGSYTFQGRRFEIQRGGHVRFLGDVPPDPVLEVRGVRAIEGVEARVDVRGRLSAPELQLGSNLPLDEADVLSMIVFNRPVNQLGATQRADLVGAAASLAGGFVTAPLTSSLGRALDLDLLELETVTIGQNAAPRLRIGQQVTNRLFVQFAQQFGAQSLSELTAEYQLSKFLRLKANTAQGPGSRAQRTLLQRVERAGLDLIFFFNY